MIDTKDGGAAFPTSLSPDYPNEMFGGISIRDYFAAKAMQGMLAYPGCESRGSHHNNNSPEGVAEMAYGYADAMLKARES